MNATEKSLLIWADSCNEINRQLVRAVQAVREGRSSDAIGLIETTRAMQLRLARELELKAGEAGLPLRAEYAVVKEAS